MADLAPENTPVSVKRVSALSGTYQTGRYGAESSVDPGIRFTELACSHLNQFSAWTNTRHDLLEALCRYADTDNLPPHAGSVTGTRGSVLQVEPLKWWLLDAPPMELDATHGVVLDISHARTRLRIEGRCAAELLNRHLAQDLRDAGAGKVQPCQLHQAPVTLWHTGNGFELFISRAYAGSVFALLQKSAAQFGFAIDPMTPA